MTSRAAEPVRVLITGSREFTQRAIVAQALTVVAREHPGRELVVVHGDAKGADRLAGAIARKYPGRLREEKHPVPDWRRADGTIDRQAGRRRNQRMVDAGADVCLAFLASTAENRGTRDCMARARAASIPVREHWDQPSD